VQVVPALLLGSERCMQAESATEPILLLEAEEAALRHLINCCCKDMRKLRLGSVCEETHPTPYSIGKCMFDLESKF